MELLERTPWGSTTDTFVPRMFPGHLQPTSNQNQGGLMTFIDLTDLEVIEETALQSAFPEWGGLVCAGGVCGLICVAA